MQRDLQIVGRAAIVNEVLCLLVLRLFYLKCVKTEKFLLENYVV